MKKMILMATALVLVGCSSSTKGERGIASLNDSHCTLQKHSSKPYYKILYKGEPMYKHWFDEKYASELLQRTVTRGKCD